MAQRRCAIRWLMLVVLGLVAGPAAARAEGWGPKSGNWVQKWISDVGNRAPDARGAGGIGRNGFAVGKRAVASVLIQTQTVTGAPTVSYGYDGRKRLTTVTTPHTTINLDYEPGGLLKRIHNGTFDEVYEYLNPSKQLESITTTNANNPVTSFAYTYSPAGNRLTETYSAQGGPAEITEYGYDTADRLTGVRYPNGETELYKLRGDGSRLGLRRFENIPNGVPLGPEAFEATAGVKLKDIVYGFDARDGLNAIQDLVSNEVGNVAHDAAGRMTTFNFDGNNRTMVWDAEDRLTAISVNGQTSSFEYDWRRWRTRETTPTRTTDYAWGPDDLISEEQVGTGNVVMYLQRLRMGQPLGLATGASSSLFAHDAAGSVVGKQDSTEAPRWSAWGSPLSASGSSLVYAGAYYVADARLLYARSRFAEPKLGRFLSLDSVMPVLALPGQSGGFQYASGNPIRFVDFRGESSQVVAGPITMRITLQKFNGKEWVDKKDDRGKTLQTRGLDIRKLKDFRKKFLDALDGVKLSSVAADDAQWKRELRKEKAWADVNSAAEVRAAWIRSDSGGAKILLTHFYDDGTLAVDASGNDKYKPEDFWNDVKALISGGLGRPILLVCGGAGVSVGIGTKLGGVESPLNVSIQVDSISTRANRASTRRAAESLAETDYVVRRVDLFEYVQSLPPTPETGESPPGGPDGQ